MEIKVSENRYGLELESLMVLAKRAQNEKRNFLFVSKLLGKHLPIDPQTSQLTGALLASLIMPPCGCEEQWVAALQTKTRIDPTYVGAYQPATPTLVLGFAETATGIGTFVAQALAGAYYVQTTRETIQELPSVLDFAEEHSHATQHNCFLRDQQPLQTAQRIILVDDELTTGQSLINLLKVLIAKTSVRTFQLVTILDWRNQDQQAALAAFAQAQGICVEVHALIKGTITHTSTHVYRQPPCPTLATTCRERLDVGLLPRVMYTTPSGPVAYYRDSGRFGVDSEARAQTRPLCVQAAKTIADHIQALAPDVKNVLVLGHGEDMAIPNQVADALTQVTRWHVAFQTTTRSPIYCQQTAGYPIQQAHQFRGHDAVTYYLYNREAIEQTYDYVIFLVERWLDVQFVDKQVTVQL